MKFSIITPTHSVKNIPFLLELYSSIARQTYTNWEWVLVLNGQLEYSNIPLQLKVNNQVKIYRPNNSTNQNIGYLKNKAAELSSGDILVEVDHDDLITENCLQALYDAYLDETIGFVFSDCAVYHMEDKFIPYNPEYGWTYKKFNWQEKELYVMNTFQPTSKSFSFIWYAPDHVRSWRKSVYNEIGGHNITLEVCDDHELLVRTYLHTNIKKVEEPLYIYRITGDNTSINHKNALIQVKTKEIFNQYALALAEKEARDKNLMCIDLGGGINGLPGYKSIDLEGADIIADLNQGIPLPDNSVGVVHASHVLEHLKDPIKSMQEIHRVLAHGGWAFIEVPSTDGRGAFQDPTHVSFWNENSFLYYTEKNLAKYIRNSTIRFCKYRCETHFPNDWMRSINVSVVSAVLIAIKSEDRFPGLWNI